MILILVLLLILILILILGAVSWRYCEVSLMVLLSDLMHTIVKTHSKLIYKLLPPAGAAVRKSV